MSEIAGLIRQFPEGSFVIIISLTWAIERVAVAFVNRNKPVVNCGCCDEEEDGEEE